MKTYHRIRLLGLALLALVATSAMSATGAQAGTFTAGAYPATITASKGIQWFWTELGLMMCKGSYEGGVLEAASEDITLVPNYGTTCEIGQKPEPQVHYTGNGCGFQLHAGSAVETDVVGGGIALVCPKGKAMEFEVTYSQVCHLTIPPQVPPQEFNNVYLRYRNETPSSVDVESNGGEIEYTLSSNCPNAGEYADGVYALGTNLTADHGGTATTFKVDG